MPKPVPDARQSSQHISAQSVNISLVKTKIPTTAQNVVSAGKHVNSCLFCLFLCVFVVVSVYENKGKRIISLPTAYQALRFQ